MFDIPFIDIPALERAGGSVSLPGSKSISNRTLLLAGLAEGTTRVHGLLASDDTRVMLDALRTLGCGIDAEPQAGSWRITGLGGRLTVTTAKLFLGNAGTAMRPLVAALAVLVARSGGDFELSGVARMHERPIGDLVDALRQLGCSIDYLGQPGYPPLRISAPGPTPLNTDAALHGALKVRGDVSSQFLSALLLALPLTEAGAAAVVDVEGDLISKPYVEITLKLLERFGIVVRREGWQRFTLPAGQTLQTPSELHVEGDASSASYFIALGAIAAVDAPLRIDGVGSDSIQGDIRFVDAARSMGAEVDAAPGSLHVRRGAWPLNAIDLDCNHIPDAAMTLAAMALYADGTSHLRNIASWRVKETDRLAAMATELRKLGATVEEDADAIHITPPAAWRAGSIRTYDDHRIAMCFSLAAFNGVAHSADKKKPAAVPVRILEPRCVGKTFPDYFETFFGVVQTPPGRIPVITIDGPTASGKGTLAAAVARALGYHHLDSGALYRATALEALRGGTPIDDSPALAAVAAGIELRFDDGRALLGGRDVSDELRFENVAALASRISALPAVRAALLGRQLDFRRVPGLVADGRDMGSVVFADASLKIFLTAGAGTRAERRHKQLISKGFSSSIDSLRSALEARDARDQQRSASPLKPAEDAVLLDNSALGIEASLAKVLEHWEHCRPFG